MVCTFNKKLLLPVTGTTGIPDMQQVPDKWRDACL